MSGGWFDAGDHVKFALPGAWSATLLAMGLLDYHQAQSCNIGSMITVEFVLSL